MAKRNDPYRNFNFRVVIEGVSAAGFSECHGLTAEIPVIEYREGGDKVDIRKLPGLPRYGNVTLKRGLTANRELWDWFRAVAGGAADRRPVSIVLLDEAGEALVSFNLAGAWPTKFELAPLDALGNDVAIETLELAHEGLSIA
jgi:phage tail-like protein